MKLKRFIGKFIPLKSTREIKELFGTVLTMEFANSMVSIFVPIFLYSIGFSLFKIVIYYTAIYIIYFFIVPLSGKWIKSRGFEHCLLYSTFFYILKYLCLFGVSYHPLFIIPTGLMEIFSRAFYWPAYHCNFAMYSSVSTQGRAIGFKYVLSSIILIVGPVIGGFVSELWGFRFLFILVVLLSIGSHIFTFSTLEKFEPEHFSYKNSFKRLFEKRNRKQLFSYMGSGEEFIGMFLWPIFIYLLVKDFSDIGIIYGISAVIMAFATLYIGRITDEKDNKSVLRFGSYIYSLVLLIRLFVTGALSISLAESLGKIGKKMIVIPISAITYKRAHNGHLVKKIIFYEMAWLIGKALIGLILIALLFLLGESMVFWQITFVLAALFALLYSLL